MLNKIPTFEGINYEKLSYTELESEILAMVDYGWDIHDLGLCSDDIHKMYGISFGDIDNKPVLYFHAQIHGHHEWQTSHWALEFCRQLSHADSLYHRLVFNQLKNKYAFYVIPCLNPFGYEHGHSGDMYDVSQWNANGVAIDANFDYHHQPDLHRGGPYPFSEVESQAVKNVFDTYKPLSLICAHTHGGYHGLAVRPNTNYKYEKLITHASKSATLSLDVWDPQYSGEIPRLENRATAYNWAGTQTSSYGLPIPGCALEPGSEETDYDKSVYGVTTLFLIFMQLDKYYTTSTQ